MSYRGLHRREGSGEFGNHIEPRDFSRGSSQPSKYNYLEKLRLTLPGYMVLCAHQVYNYHQ